MMDEHEQKAIAEIRQAVREALARGDEYEYQAATDRGIVLIARFVYAGTLQVEVYWEEGSGRPEPQDLLDFSQHIDAIVGRRPEHGVPGPDYFALMGGGMG